MTSKMLLPTEHATAEELIEFSNDIDRFSYEYLIIYKLLNKEQLFNIDLMRQAKRFLIQRHPNFLAYYIKNKDGSLERKYHKQNGKVFVQFDIINQAQVKNYIKQRRNLDVFTSIPSQRYYFMKTENEFYIMSYSHHAFKDVLIDQIVMEQLLSIYYSLLANPKASFQESTKHLPKIATYDEVLSDFYQTNKKKLNELISFLQPKFHNWQPPKDSPLDHNTTLCKANKVRSFFYDSIAIREKKFKPNICLLSLVLLSLQKSFNVEGTLPIWKLNGSRPKVAEGVLCSYIKDQVFIHPLNPQNTFKMQYQENYCQNKQNLIHFNHCDYTEAIQEISKQMGKDCLPKVCFNFYISNQNSKHTYAYKQLSDEYDVVNSIMNIYFDVMFDNLTKEYSITIFYKKNIFEDQKIREVMEFMVLGYKYLHLISNVEIEKITLEFLRNLENFSVKKLQVAKPKL